MERSCESKSWKTSEDNIKAKLVIGAVTCVVCVCAFLLVRHEFAMRERKQQAELDALKTQLNTLEHRLKATEARLAEMDERTRLVVRPLSWHVPSTPEETVFDRHSPVLPSTAHTRTPNAIEDFDVNGQKFYLTPLANRR